MGKHTLMSAIPSKWIKRHNIKTGDFLEFTEVENKLVITSTAEIFERKTEITIISPTEMVVWRSIQPTYTSGYDEVKINFKERKTLKIIDRFINNLIGFEIVDTSKDFVIVKSVSKNLDEEFSTILRRVFFILENMMETTKIAFEKKNKNQLEEIETLENTMNRYTMFLKRIINRSGYKYPHYMYLMVSFLELTANHLYYLKRYFSKYPKKIISSEEIREFNRIYELNKKVYNLYYTFDNRNFNWIAEELPHFMWFGKIKDSEIKFNFKTMTEYLVQISRQIKAMHT